MQFTCTCSVECGVIVTVKHGCQEHIKVVIHVPCLQAAMLLVLTVSCDTSSALLELELASAIIVLQLVKLHFASKHATDSINQSGRTQKSLQLWCCRHLQRLQVNAWSRDQAHSWLVFWMQITIDVPHQPSREALQGAE